MLLNILHWLFAIMLWMSSIIVPNKYLNFALCFQIMIFISWLLTERCILWDIQKKIDPSFKVKADTSSERFGIDRTLWLYITHSAIYLNTLYLGYRMNKLQEVIVLLVIYMCFNGQYFHKGDDDLNKYAI